MRLRKRVRAMIQIFSRQVDHLRADQQAHLDRTLTQGEYQQLTTELESIHQDLQKIAPPAPLTWKEWLIRGGVGFVFVFAVGSIAAWKLQLLSIAVKTNVSGQEGGAVESQYVPVTATNVLEFPLVDQVSRGAVVEIESFSSLSGNIVGLVPDGPYLMLFYTQPDEDGLLRLTRQRLDADGNTAGPAVTFTSEQSVVDASVLLLEEGWLISRTTETDEGVFMVVEKYDVDFELSGPQVLLRPLEYETFDGLSLAHSGSSDQPYVLLTLQDKGEMGSITDTRRIVLRRFTDTLEMTNEEVLVQPNMNADSHASLLPFQGERAGTGFIILTNGGEPFKYDRIEKGDELIAMTYGVDNTPVEFFRLTNNGRPHDYWPESALQEDGFILFSYVKQMLAPNAATAGQYVFPPGSGNVLVAAVDPLTFEAVGGVLVTDYQPQPVDGEEAKVGATRPSIAKVGKRLYVAFDEYTVDDPYSDSPTRRVLVQWVDLNR